MFEEFPSVNIGTVKLGPDAIMVAYTDGLIELENELGVAFNEQVLDSLFKDGSIYTMSGLNVRIFEALDAHRGKEEFHDDVALVSCRFL